MPNERKDPTHFAFGVRRHWRLRFAPMTTVDKPKTTDDTPTIADDAQKNSGGRDWIPTAALPVAIAIFHLLKMSDWNATTGAAALKYLSIWQLSSGLLVIALPFTGPLLLTYMLRYKPFPAENGVKTWCSIISRRNVGLILVSILVVALVWYYASPRYGFIALSLLLGELGLFYVRLKPEKRVSSISLSLLLAGSLAFLALAPIAVTAVAVVVATVLKLWRRACPSAADHGSGAGHKGVVAHDALILSTAVLVFLTVAQPSIIEQATVREGRERTLVRVLAVSDGFLYGIVGKERLVMSSATDAENRKVCVKARVSLAEQSLLMILLQRYQYPLCVGA